MMPVECRYCGAPDCPVRQVPAPVPFSDAYCDNPACVQKCHEMYMKTYKEYRKAQMKDRSPLEPQFEFVLRPDGTYEQVPATAVIRIIEDE